MCRFCFDDSSTEKLIAPCGCTGSAKWVHQTCLIKWQKASMRAYSGHESVCSVCNVTYALPPPVMPKSPLRAGMLLVASPTLGGTFERSVVLLCEPILTTLFAWLFLSEAPTLQTVIGGVLVLVGVYVSTRGESGA